MNTGLLVAPAMKTTRSVENPKTEIRRPKEIRRSKSDRRAGRARCPRRAAPWQPTLSISPRRFGAGRHNDQTKVSNLAERTQATDWLTSLCAFASCVRALRCSGTHVSVFTERSHSLGAWKGRRGDREKGGQGREFVCTGIYQRNPPCQKSQISGFQISDCPEGRSGLCGRFYQTNPFPSSSLVCIRGSPAEIAKRSQFAKRTHRWCAGSMSGFKSSRLRRCLLSLMAQ